jgi:methyltransferase (TIGR00027 family)
MTSLEMPRTLDDTWGLSTGVGVIATLRAAARAKASRAAHPLIEDRFAEPLVRAVGIDFFTRLATGELDPADVDEPDVCWGLRQLADESAARTRFFDDFFAHAMAAGIRQAVILGSGLDTRAYRLAWPAGMTVFEIDQPEVLGFKAATLAELGAKPQADLRMVPADLRREWPAALLHFGFATCRPTAWIAEGLLLFLPPVAQDRLLDYVTALSANGSWLATENFVQNGHPDGVRAEQILRRVNQRWQEHGLEIEIWDLSFRGRRHNVAAYLQRYGWQSTATTTGNLLARNCLQAIAHGSHQPAFAGNICYFSFLPRKRALRQKIHGPR